MELASHAQVEQVKAGNFKISMKHNIPGRRMSPVLSYHHLLAEKENTTGWIVRTCIKAIGRRTRAGMGIIMIAVHLDHHRHSREPHVAKSLGALQMTQGRQVRILLPVDSK